MRFFGKKIITIILLITFCLQAKSQDLFTGSEFRYRNSSTYHKQDEIKADSYIKSLCRTKRTAYFSLINSALFTYRNLNRVRKNTNDLFKHALSLGAFSAITSFSRITVNYLESFLYDKLQEISPDMLEAIEYIKSNNPMLFDVFWCFKEATKEVIIHKGSLSIYQRYSPNLLKHEQVTQDQGTLSKTSEHDELASPMTPIFNSKNLEDTEENKDGFSTPVSSPVRKKTSPYKESPPSAMRQKIRVRLKELQVSPSSSKRLEETSRRLAYNAANILKERKDQIDEWRGLRKAKISAFRSSQKHRMENNKKFGKKIKWRLGHVIDIATTRDIMKKKGYDEKETKDFFDTFEGLSTPQKVAALHNKWGDVSHLSQSPEPTLPITPKSHILMHVERTHKEIFDEDYFPNTVIYMDSHQNKHQTKSIDFGKGAESYRGIGGSSFGEGCNTDWHIENTAKKLLQYAKDNMDSLIKCMRSKDHLPKLIIDDYGYHVTIESHIDENTGDEFMALSYHCWPE